MKSDQYHGLPGVSHLPEGWKVVRAEDICTKITKGTTPPKVEMEGGKIPFLRVNNLTFAGKLNTTNDMVFVSEKSHRGFLARSIAYPNDVLMNIVGPPLGKTALLTDAFAEYNLNQAIIIYRPDLTKVNPVFLLSFLNTVTAQQWLQSNSKKTSGQQNLTIEICKKLPVILPPIEEQKTIAQALATWDQEFSLLDKLIENRGAQQLGLMQELLSGRRRFTGFTPWVQRPLGELIEEIRRDVACTDEAIYRLVSIRRRSGGVFLRETLPGRKILTKNLKEVHDGDFVISKMQVVHGAMGLITKEFQGHHISGSYIAVVPRDKKVLDIQFFDWFCRQRSTYHKAFLNSYGVHIEKMTFDFEGFLHEKINIPSDIAEQRKIVSVLSSSEREIRILEKIRDSIRLEKKVLTQQLLIGGRRLTKGSNLPVAAIG